jgi:hypothetical protein
VLSRAALIGFRRISQQNRYNKILARNEKLKLRTTAVGCTLPKLLAHRARTGKTPKSMGYKTGNLIFILIGFVFTLKIY